MYRFEIVLERSRESLLPEIDLVVESGLGDVESLGGDVYALVVVFVRKVDQGQRNVCTVETLHGETRQTRTEIGVYGGIYRRSNG